MAEKIRRHLYISGRVQGVGFRASTRRKANSLNLKGWVRNLRDGRVEAVIEGEKKDVEYMINYLKDGPSLAVVEDIEIFEEDYKNQFQTFTIKH